MWSTDTRKKRIGPGTAPWHTANGQIPDLAGQYGTLASGVADANSGTEKAFSRDVLIAGGASYGEGPGPLYPSWSRLHEEFLSILKGSTANLNAVGATLRMAVEAFAEQDTAAADELRNRYGGELPYE